VFPTHGPFSHWTPVARSTFCDRVNLATAVFALAYAAAQSGESVTGVLGVLDGELPVVVLEVAVPELVALVPELVVLVTELVVLEVLVVLVVDLVVVLELEEAEPARHWE